MSAMVVAARELREKSRLFLVSLLLAVVPFVAAAVPGARGDRLSVIVLVGAVLAVAIGGGSAVMLGVSTIGKELAEKRMSFYFSKPLSPAAIWGGKALGSLAISIGCFLIVALPLVVVETMRVQRRAEDLAAIGMIAIAGFVAIFFLSHALSSMTRSRSAWLAVDFVCLVAASFLIVMIIRPILLGGGMRVAVVVASVIVGALMLILALAPIRQLAIGRTDIRRAHLALSVTIWIAVALLVAVSGAFVAWLVTPSPSQLHEIEEIEQSPAGNAFVVTGTARGRGDLMSTFIVEPSSGRSHRIAAPRWWGSRYSRDGKVFAWLQPTGILARELELYVSRAGDEGIATGIRGHAPMSFVLSDDGGRVAIQEGSTLSVHDLAARRMLASAKLDARPANAVPVMIFVRPDLLRIYEYQPRGSRVAGEAQQLVIRELDVASKRLSVTGEGKVSSSWNAIGLSADGTTMLVRHHGVIADARTGATLATIPVSGGNDMTNAMLSDGQVASMARDDRGTTLRFYRKDGTLRHQTRVENFRIGWVWSETRDGKLLLATSSKPGDVTKRGRSMVVVDVASGNVERVIPALFAGMPTWGGDGRLPLINASQRLAGVDGEGNLVLWSVRTGEKVPFEG